MMRLKCTILLLLFTAVLMGGCTKNRPKGIPAKIPAFKKKKLPKTVSPIRLQALKDIALSVGSQGGLAWRSAQINKTLKKNERHLFQVFNFNAMLLKNNVLPPVLVEGRRTLNLANDESIRLANRVYKMLSPPRFVTAPPTWREYLWMHYKKPDVPDATLLPRNRTERYIWNKYIVIGWEKGVALANEIYSANLNRLQRDYKGMALYRVLLAQNMVTAPFVAKTELGITGDEKEMRLDDRVLRIATTSKLNLDSKTWKPSIYNQKKNKRIDDYIEKIEK